MDPTKLAAAIAAALAQVQKSGDLDADARQLAAIENRLKVCKSIGQVQREPAMVQFVAVAKGIIAPEDIRIGGTLRPQESAQMFNAVVAANATLGKVMTEQTARLKKDIPVLDMVPRQLQRVAEGSKPTTFTGVSQKGGTLHVLPAQLFAKLPLSFLRDNADNPQIVPLIRAMLNTIFGNDLNDLGWNGTDDDNSDGFLTLNKGWLQVLADSAAARKTVIEPGATSTATLTTGVVANDTALVWTAVETGSPGNGVAVALLDPAANGSALAITVSGKSLFVSLATDGGGDITTTGAQLIAAVAGNANAAALVSVANATGSDGSGVLEASALRNLAGGVLVGWVDALAQVRAASNPLIRPTAEFFMHPDDADSYNLELGKHVTGSAVLATSDGAGFMRQTINPDPYLPQGVVVYTPPKNLYMGQHQTVERSSNWDGVERATTIVIDQANDYAVRMPDYAVIADATGNWYAGA